MVADPHYCSIPGQYSKSRASDSNFKASEHRAPSIMFYHF